VNPNDYDDEAFIEASNEFQGDATEMFERLWKAGASADDIVNEINTALANATGIINSTGSPLTVESV
jgi:hypothetical protein